MGAAPVYCSRGLGTEYQVLIVAQTVMVKSLSLVWALAKQVTIFSRFVCSRVPKHAGLAELSGSEQSHAYQADGVQTAFGLQPTTGLFTNFS